MDKRLQTCLDLYVPGDTGADIGTDHALLPCAVLRRGLCRHMILSDISPSALEHARQQVQRQGLEDRVTLRLADGLQALDRTCCCISVTGMGAGDETVSLDASIWMNEGEDRPKKQPRASAFQMGARSPFR